MSVEARRGCQILWGGVTGSCEPLMWELGTKLEPLEEPYVFLTAEASLESPK